MLNVLVVEDEEYVRKSIVYKVDWERIASGCSGCGFSLEALIVEHSHSLLAVFTFKSNTKIFSDAVLS